MSRGLPIKASYIQAVNSISTPEIYTDRIFKKNNEKEIFKMVEDLESKIKELESKMEKLTNTLENSSTTKGKAKNTKNETSMFEIDLKNIKDGMGLLWSSEKKKFISQDIYEE